MSSHVPHSQWPRDVAKRLRLTGDVQFTPAAVGQTLHIPCHAGHIADVKIGPNQHPQQVIKKMMNLGWSLGTHLKCPEHSCRKSGREMDREYRERKKKKDQTPMENMEIPKPVMASAPIAPVMSDAAKKAHRMVMMALEDYYDESAKAYRKGHSDETVAQECKVSKDHVIKVREEFFGPLGEPTELTEARAELQSLQNIGAALLDDVNTLRLRMTDYESKISANTARIKRVCDKNGWLF